MPSASLTKTTDAKPTPKKVRQLKRGILKKLALQYLVACNAEMISNFFEVIVQASIKAIDHIIEII